MAHHDVRRISDTSFFMQWVGLPNTGLTIDFKPIITHYDLKGSFCLIHWQAKPKNHRRWGVYDSTSKQYYSFQCGQLEFQSNPWNLLQVDERIVKTVPTAVVHIPNSKVVWTENKLAIKIVNPNNATKTTNGNRDNTINNNDSASDSLISGGTSSIGLENIGNQEPTTGTSKPKNK